MANSPISGSNGTCFQFVRKSTGQAIPAPLTAMVKLKREIARKAAAKKWKNIIPTIQVVNDFYGHS